MNRLLLSTLWALSFFATLPCVQAQQDGWPRTLPLEQGMVTIYALQVDQMDEDILHYRAALAYRLTPDAEPVFGAGWFESQVEVDQDGRIVHPRNLKVTETRFPAGTDDIQPNLAKALAEQSSGWNLDFSLDELHAALKTAEAESLQNLNTQPPRIIYRDHPALLISIDGDPVRREIEGSPYQAVINTPYPLITDGRTYYLNAAKSVWYRADKVTGPYHFDVSPPVEIVAMVEADDPETVAGSTMESVTAANAPEVVVSTEPAELLVTEGPAAFVPLVDDLLVLQNSEDDVFMHVSTQQFYIVLAGRWYHASSLNGPWTYRAADELPSAFARIPQDSNQYDSRVYIAGTEEAREAVLDAHVPQTAAVVRGEVDIDVAYDGEPNFESVDGADLAYADNTGSTVLQSDRLYYLVEDGVWYVSETPNGPWQVSDYRPDQVDTILPSSPVYNVRYVHVYDSTPEVVYVGYTPGYTGSYIYHNTIVYGTGWYYRPWVSHRYYYPRHSTWGFGVRYDPWYGWNFGLSWSWGPFSFGYYPGGYWHRNQYWHHRYYSHWGPGGYRHRAPRYGHGGHDRNRYAYNDYGHDKDRGGHDRRGNNDERSRNLYSDQAQRARIADTRDRPYRSRSGRDDVARHVDNTGTHSSRAQTQIGDRKVGRSRTTPVRTADLAMKASIRDANLDARQSKLYADNKGKVYRRTDRDPQRRTVSDRGSKTAKGERNRIMPVPRTGGEQLASLNISPTARASSRQTQGRVSASSNQQRSSAPPRQTQRRVSASSDQQRSSAPPRQTQRRASTSSNQQRSSAPSRQASSRAGNSQAKRQPSRAVTAPAPKPQSRGNSSGQKTRQSAPASSGQKKGHQKANKQKSSSKHGRGNRRTG